MQRCCFTTAKSAPVAFELDAKENQQTSITATLESERIDRVTQQDPKLQLEQENTKSLQNQLETTRIDAENIVQGLVDVEKQTQSLAQVEIQAHEGADKPKPLAEQTDTAIESAKSTEESRMPASVEALLQEDDEDYPPPPPLPEEELPQPTALQNGIVAYSLMYHFNTRLQSQNQQLQK